jgi:hypothetical protein
VATDYKRRKASETGESGDSVSRGRSVQPARCVAGHSPGRKIAEEARIMNTNPIVVEQVFNAPIADVWKAITDNDRMRW